MTRIPDLPLGRMVTEEGEPTDEELTFRQSLISNLQSWVGNEGLVAPTQTAADITIIQNNTQGNQSGFTMYTCGFGRILYDVTNNKMVVSIDDGTGVPIFKEIMLI